MEAGGNVQKNYKEITHKLGALPEHVMPWDNSTLGGNWHKRSTPWNNGTQSENPKFGFSTICWSIKIQPVCTPGT